MIDYSDNKRRNRGKMSARTPPILHFWVELGIDLIMWLRLRPGLGLVSMTWIGLEWYLGFYECSGGVVVEMFIKPLPPFIVYFFQLCTFTQTG